MLRPGRLRAATGSRSKEFSGGQSSTKEEAAIQPGIRSWRKSGLAYGRLSRRGSIPKTSTTPADSGARSRPAGRRRELSRFHRRAIRPRSAACSAAILVVFMAFVPRVLSVIAMMLALIVAVPGLGNDAARSHCNQPGQDAALDDILDVFHGRISGSKWNTIITETRPPPRGAAASFGVGRAPTSGGAYV